MNEGELDPKLILELVAAHVPRELHVHLLIVGSLAAAYHYRELLPRHVVRTKDADIIVQPAGALAECRDIAERLLDAKWRPTSKCWPCQSPEPTESLRIIRIHPPGTDLYFIELLGLPLPSQRETKRLEPCQLRDGWYAVPCFRFMAVLRNARRASEFNIEYASPALMSLANMLSHPTLGTATIEGMGILRSAKDLGRVLALAFLTPDEELEEWPAIWWNALSQHFPEEATTLSERVGGGIRELLANEAILNDAHNNTQTGLLSGKGVTKEQLRITGQRLLNDVVRELQKRAQAPSP